MFSWRPWSLSVDLCGTKEQLPALQAFVASATEGGVVRSGPLAGCTLRAKEHPPERY